MLRSLFIQNYAIIDELSIDFNRGFNVFTGETGAGKSIIVGALTYLIRGKADTSIIKTGRDKAIIEGVFDIEEDMKPLLDEAEIEYDDSIIVRRIMSRDSHNSIKINQTNVTLNFLINLFDGVIDIHSQKDNQFLLNKKNHLNLLDHFCNNDELLKTYKDSYDYYKLLQNQYDELLNNTYNEKDLDYLKYDLNELEAADLKVDEEEELLEKEKRYKQSEKLLTSLNNVMSLYSENEGIKEKLSSLLHCLDIDDNDIIDVKNNINNIYYSLDDEVSKLSSILESFNDDDFNIEYLEERLYTYSKLKRKHNRNVSELIEYKESLKDKIAFFDDKDTVLKKKKDELDIAYNKAFDLAKQLSMLRFDKAKDLDLQVIKQTEDLMLKNVQFKTMINTVDLNSNGIDDVEFYISLNKGEDLKPLKNVASGGEMSRLMLSLKTVFTKLSNCQLVIFDEIDTGVSGKVALAMGEKMSSISKSCQVLTITHLAPVAACADYNYYIYKDNDSQTSNTRIKQLNHEEIIQELANISSTDSSDNALKAAEELYNNAQKLIHEN